jgi:glyoxylase-like metal-dependent hydrolase (beta-lactamase superfamily II)
MSIVTEVSEGIYQVLIPVPFPLKTVNCYLIREDNGWTLLDTGLQDALAHEAWEAALRELNMSARDIQRIFLTHAHPDHYGLAGHFQRLSDAPVYMLDEELRVIPLEWQADGERMHKHGVYMQRHGAPTELTQQIVLRELDVLRMLTPQPTTLLPLHEGDVVTLGGQRYRVVWTPGHADGHCIYHGLDNGVTFMGDHILMKITPNIPLWAELDPNPLKNYLASLTKVETLTPRLVLPGHRATFSELRGRIAELRAHHAERAQACWDAAGEGRTAYEICLTIFPGVNKVDDLRMALVETLSHVEYLVSERRLARENGELVRYEQVREERA